MSPAELGQARPDANAPLASDERRPQLRPDVLGPLSFGFPAARIRCATDVGELRLLLCRCTLAGCEIEQCLDIGLSNIAQQNIKTPVNIRIRETGLPVNLRHRTKVSSLLRDGPLRGGLSFTGAE
jgi:hypothetical protein